MKRTRTLALLTALVCLCVSLTACSPKEVLKSAILKTTTALGLRQETSDEDEVDDLSYATGGGDVTFPETMDTTASKLVSEVDGDTLLWNPLLESAFEVSSMGIRVDERSLARQLDLRGERDKESLYFHRKLLAGELPCTIGGGIGQSRLCMFLLRKAHIGEVQVSIWPEQMTAECAAHGIYLK